MSSVFNIKEHIIEAAHIREYARATANAQDERLVVHVKQYFPRDNPEPKKGDVTIIGGHANGFPKVCCARDEETDKTTNTCANRSCTSLSGMTSITKPRDTMFRSEASSLLIQHGKDKAAFSTKSLLAMIVRPPLPIVLFVY